MNAPALPETVTRAIDAYYATPIKTARNGAKHDIDQSSLRRCEALALAALIQEFRPVDTLEIGLAEGGSCIAITSARVSLGMESRHVALDPYQETWAEGIGLTELERLGLREQVSWLPEYSENYLSAAHAHGDKFDFIFVDGGHDIGQKVTDAFYIGRVLRPGGIVAFHDGLFFSTSVAVRHLIQECRFRALLLPPDDRFHRLARSIRHGPRLGGWYAANVIPKMCRSLVAMQKPL